MTVDLDARLAPGQLRPGLPVYYEDAKHGWCVGAVASAGADGVVVDAHETCSGLAMSGRGQPAGKVYPCQEAVDAGVADLSLLREPHEPAVQRHVHTRAAAGKGCTSVGKAVVLAVDPRHSADVAMSGAQSELWRLADRTLEKHLQEPEGTSIAITGGAEADRQAASRGVVRQLLSAMAERRVPRSPLLPGGMPAVLDDAEAVVDAFGGVSVPAGSGVATLPRTAGAVKLWFRHGSSAASGHATPSASRSSSKAMHDRAAALALANESGGAWSRRSSGSAVQGRGVGAGGRHVQFEGVELAVFLSDTNRALFGYPGVRAYEVFYQVFYGASCGAYAPVPLPRKIEDEMSHAARDAARSGFAATQAALEGLDVPAAAVDAVFRVVAALGYLCQVAFDTDGGDAGVADTTQRYLDQAAVLLGLEAPVLAAALCELPEDPPGNDACYTRPTAPVDSDIPAPPGTAVNDACRTALLNAAAGVDVAQLRAAAADAAATSVDESWLTLRRNAVVAHVYARLVASIMDLANTRLAPALRGGVSMADMGSKLHEISVLSLASPGDVPSLCAVERWCHTATAETVRALFGQNVAGKAAEEFTADGVALAGYVRYTADPHTHPSLRQILAADGAASVTSTVADVVPSGLSTEQFLSVLNNRFTPHEAFRDWVGENAERGFAVHTSSGWGVHCVDGWIGRAATGSGVKTVPAAAAVADLLHLIGTGRLPMGQGQEDMSFELNAEDHGVHVHLPLGQERLLEETGWTVGCHNAPNIVDGFRTWLRDVVRAVDGASWVVCVNPALGGGAIAQLRALRIPAAVELHSYAQKSYENFASRYAPIEGFDTHGRRGAAADRAPSAATKQLLAAAAAEDAEAFASPAVVMGRGSVFLRRGAVDVLEARLGRARGSQLETLLTVLQTFGRVRLSSHAVALRRWKKAAKHIQKELRGWVARSGERCAAQRQRREEIRIHFDRLLRDLVADEEKHRLCIEDELEFQNIDMHGKKVNAGRELRSQERRAAKELFDRAYLEKEAQYNSAVYQLHSLMGDTFRKHLLVALTTSEEVARRHIQYTERESEWGALLSRFDHLLSCANIVHFFGREKTQRGLMARLEILQRVEIKQRVVFFEEFEQSLSEAVEPWLDCLDAVKYWATHMRRRNVKLAGKRSQLRELADYETAQRNAPVVREFHHRDGPNRVERFDAWKGCTGVPDADHLKSTQERACLAKPAKPAPTPSPLAGSSSSPRRYQSPSRAQVFTDTVVIPAPPARYSSRTGTPQRGRPAPSTPRSGGGALRTPTPTSARGAYLSTGTPAAQQQQQTPDPARHLSPPREVAVARVMAKSPMVTDHAVRKQVRREAAGETAPLGDIGGYTPAQFLTARQAFIEKFAALRAAGFYPYDGAFLQEASIRNIKTLRLAQEKLHDARVAACVQLYKTMAARNQFIRKYTVLEEVAVGGKWHAPREGDTSLNFHTDPGIWVKIKEEVDRLGHVIAHHKVDMVRILKVAAEGGDAEGAAVLAADLTADSPFTEVHQAFKKWVTRKARVHLQLLHASPADTFGFVYKRYLPTQRGAPPPRTDPPRSHPTSQQHISAVSPLRRRSGLPP